MRKIILFLILTLLLAGCAAKPQPRERVVLLPDEQGKVGRVEVRTQTASVQLTEARQTVEVDEITKALTKRSMASQEIDSRFDKAMQAMPKPPVRFMLYFRSGTTELTDASEQLLPELLQVAEERIPCEVGIVGHTDTEGDEEANLALGLERAFKVHDLLIERGADPSMIAVESHGEKNLLVQTENEVDEPKNRRVEVVIR